MNKLTIALLLAVPLLGEEHVDLPLVDRIKAEAFDRSQVMDHLFYLTDVYGPRLTGSPEFEQAAKWAMERLRSYGLANVHTERWGPFGRSWSLQKYSVEMLEPRYSLLNAAPLAWSSPAGAFTTGDIVMAPFDRVPRRGLKRLEQNFEEYRKTWTGKLRGKVVLLTEPKPPKEQTAAHFHRYSDAELADLTKAPDPSSKLVAKSLDELKWPEDPEELAKFLASLPEPLLPQLYARFDRLRAELGKFFATEGAAAVLIEDERAHEGLVFAEAAGSAKSAYPLAAPTFTVTAEHYDRIVRTLEKKTPLHLRFELKAAASERDVDAWNIVGEIPGGAKKEEIVMIGAHFDSWHTGTGTTDNGAGSAVMMEVMRIFKALDLKPERTVRIALWGGEEQGLLGSRAYVKEHFGDPETMKLTADHARLSGYFNLDNGSGKIRGVYLQGHEAMRPIFEQWLAPFRDLGAGTITIRNTGGTDHLSFNAVGLPGFQFIQDPLDYMSVTHHSSMDVYDHAESADLMQAAAVITAVVYHAANRDELLPRRELAKPR